MDSQNIGKSVLLYEENGIKKIIIGKAGNEMATLRANAKMPSGLSVFITEIGNE